MDVEVRRDDYRVTRVVDGAGDGNVRIDRFALTANNVTYAVMGDTLDYWSFFGASEGGWGRVPVWGVGEVVETGEWIYGYFPMSSQATMRLDERLFERSEHRSGLPATYNRYVRVTPDTPHLDEMLLLRPLFGTSFLLSDFLSGDDATVVLGSASSKTAYGLAFLLDRPVVGLTSARNREFAESLGVYDRVLTYDEVEALRGEAVVYVDMSGDGSVREALHAAADVRRDVAVGATHWDRIGSGSGGAQPEFFFAPSHIEKMAADLGAAEMQRRMGEAWNALAARVGDWMQVERGSGPDEVQRVWRSLVDGDVDPRRGHVLTLAS
ncbi:MAG TPA: DUF2855 family protein [Solirubrobacteraceae bacterium]|nr:DUF2855 family protein [Solirubrobacteraceae bacterium]